MGGIVGIEDAFEAGHELPEGFQTLRTQLAGLEEQSPQRRRQG
jgi:hypothetical protein